MKVHLYTSLNWPTVLLPKQQAAFDHLTQAAALLPFYHWPEKSIRPEDNATGKPKRKPKNIKRLEKQCGLQSIWNVWLDQELRARGFMSEVQVRPEEKDDNQRMDHGYEVENGQLVCVESEFGNSAHCDSNTMKFLDAFSWGRAALCVMICPVAHTAAITTGGSITFEQTVGRLRRLHPDTVRGPIAVIGVDHEHPHHVNLRETRITDPDLLSGNSDKRVLWHVVSEHRAGVTLESIGLPQDLEAKFAGIEKRPVSVKPQAGLFDG